MTNILVIGDIVRLSDGFDMIIGLTLAGKAILDRRGLSDDEYYDVIGHFDSTENKVTLFDEEDL